MKHTADWVFLCSTVLLLTAASAAPAVAQTPDTTDAARYFPLAVDNAWEYRSEYIACPVGCGEDEVLGYWRWTAVRDSLVNGVQYFVLREERYTAQRQPEEDGVRDLLVRFDPDLARGARLYENGEESYWPDEAPCRLDSDFDGPPDCNEYGGFYKKVLGGYDEVIFVGGEPYATALKYFEGVAGGIGFAADIGFFYSGFGKDPYWFDYLTFARIDGVEYGTEQFPVAAESTPTESGLALGVFPNPAASRITVRFALPTAQRATLSVFDMLGRRVRSVDLGAQPAGEASHRLDLGGLAPGLYVVRLTGDAGAAATARIVRR